MRIFVFRKRDLYIAAVLILIIIVGLLLFWQFNRGSAVSSIQLKYSYQRLLPEEAYSLIENNTDVIILDVRSKKEFDKGHLKNAQMLPLKELKGQIEELDRQSTYVVYCENGKDSLKASKILAESGFSRVYTITGGYNKWPYGITKVY